MILRDRLYMLLTRYGQRPADTRGLHLLFGAACVLLASISHDLAEPSAAMIQTRTALTFAEIAEHTGLITWVYCVCAMIASWWGAADDVLRHAQRARAVGLGGVGAIRLAGLANFFILPRPNVTSCALPIPAYETQAKSSRSRWPVSTTWSAGAPD